MAQKTEKGTKKTEKELTDKEKIFCVEYCTDWNAARAARAAGYSEKTAKEIGYENLTKPHILEFVKKVVEDIEKSVGISKIRVLKELMNIAFSNIAALHETWIERKDFENLTDMERACISEISTKVDKLHNSDGVEIGVAEFVKIKLYDKLKALEKISEIMGYDAPIKVDQTTKIEGVEFKITKK